MFFPITKYRTCGCLLLLLFACNGNNSIDKIDVSSSATRDNFDRSKTDPDSSVIYFLKWYRENEERLNKIQMVAGGLADSTTNYYIDFPVAEKYLSELRSSGFLSDFFLSDLMDFFKRCNVYLKKHPQNDGPPPGLDADLIMKRQDYQDIWDSLGKAKSIEKVITQNTSVIHLSFNKYSHEKYYLSKSGNQWLIDSIGSSFKTNAYYSLQ